MTAPAELDFSVVEAKAGLAFGYLSGAIVSGMIHLGDRLGLYQRMAGAGPLTSEDLAAKAGLSERWVREWLRGQAAAGIITHRGAGRFELTAEEALVFADESTPASVIGAFGDLPDQIALLRHTPESFRTGLGLTYDQAGPAVATGVERMVGPWNRSALVGEALPKIDGLIARLEKGAKVADVGCGAGVATVAMAQAFPNSSFHGYDNSLHALARAAANLSESGLSNLTFHNADSDPLPADASFDFVTCLDCLHDMAHPEIVAAAIRKAIKPDGIWFIVDVNCADNWEDNMENPLGAMLYGFSVLLCMSSSMSVADGLGLGTAGLPPARMKQLVTDAGFNRFAPVPGLEHPFNAYYVVRP
ncbi:MAG: methyltransferase domain-containing protein [Tepidiformaceae bacterium]